MNEPTPIDDANLAEVVTLPRGQVWLAWIVIWSIALGIPILRASAQQEKAASATDRLGSTILEVQSRYLVGAAKALGPAQGRTFLEQSRMLNAGPVRQRLRFVPIAGELGGAKDALETLRDLEERVRKAEHPLEEEDKKLIEILSKLYGDYISGHLHAPAVSDEEKQRLREELGWTGSLALVPNNGPDPEGRDAVLRPAMRTFLLLISASVLGIAMAFIGLVGLVFVIVMAFGGLVQPKFKTGSFSSGIYAETFALWMVLYMALLLVASAIDAGSSQLLLAGAAFILSLAALAWPVVRGKLAWQNVREEIGLVGSDVPKEVALGIGGYVMGLPLMALGILTVMGLMFVQRLWQGGQEGANEFSHVSYPSHPIVQMLTGPDWWPKIQVFIIASVIAPIVEETMFRGVLYRHVREATRNYGIWVSLVLSVLVVSFVFAVVHPQGLIAIPALMSLACAFSLLREWRGSLISSMVAHGLNNGLVLLLVVLLFGS